MLQKAAAAPDTHENKPHRIEAMSLLGAFLHDAGRLDEAAHFLQHVINVGGGNANEFINLAGIPYSVAI